jgi:hypothetical protein
MLNTVFNAPHLLLQRAHDLHPLTDDQLRVKYLVLVLAAAGVILVAAIVASVGVRVW